MKLNLKLKKNKRNKKMNELEQKRMNVNIELRSLSEKVTDGTMKAEDAKAKQVELRSQKSEIEKQIALANKPTDTRTTTSLADVSKAMLEKRAITLNGTGAISQVKELTKELQAKTPILEKVRYFYGANAQTNIPVLSPTIATPGNYAEGVTNVAADTQAILGSTNLTPYAYISLLPISAEALTLGSVNIESELTGIFSDAFAQAFHNGILTGDGSGRNPTGIFTSIPEGNKIQCAAVGAPKIVDLAKLALSIQDLTDNGVIVLHSSIYSQILADPTTGVAELYKEELIRSKTIEGVHVILTSASPSSIATGSVVAVAGNLDNYAFGLASEIAIKPKEKVGDSNTYFEATVFANGKPILAKNFWGLVTK
jgi:HK97 family phage major capsid protein